MTSSSLFVLFIYGDDNDLSVGNDGSAYINYRKKSLTNKKFNSTIKITNKRG